MIDEWHICREDFGLTLYEAVRCCGAIAQISHQMGMVERTERQQRHYAVELIRERAALATVMPLLSEDEVQRLLLHYPWIATL